MTSLNSVDKEKEGFDDTGKNEKLLENEFETNMEDQERPTIKSYKEENHSDFTADQDRQSEFKASDLSPETYATGTRKAEPTIKKTLTERYFSPIREGSIRSSIFAIASVCLGMGTMAMPMAFSKASLAGGVVFLTTGALLGYWSLCILIESSRRINSENYSDSVKKVFNPIASKILDICIFLNCFGNILGYMITIPNLLGITIWELFLNKKNYPAYENFQVEWEAPLVGYSVTFGLAVIFLPLCLVKDISKMVITNAFAIISLLYVVFIVVIESPQYYRHFTENNKEKTDEINWYRVDKAFNLNMDVFTSLATFFYVFNCHSAALPIYKSLNNNITRRVQKVIRRSLLVDLVVYMSTGICGFLTVPINTPPIIIFREKMGETDFSMIIARIGMALNLAFSVPCMYNGMRLSLLELIWGSKDLTDKRNWILTVCTLCVVSLISVNFKDIEIVIGILGGLLVVILSYVYPSLIYVKTNNHPRWHWKNVGSMLLLSFTIIVGLGATSKTLYDLFTLGKKK